jgi:hypothetical protein
MFVPWYDYCEILYILYQICVIGLCLIREALIRILEIENNDQVPTQTEVSSPKERVRQGIGRSKIRSKKKPHYILRFIKIAFRSLIG